MLLAVNPRQFEAMQRASAEEWVDTHVAELSRIASDRVAPYSSEDLRALVTRMLTHADRAAIHPQEATIAYCYAALHLGVGFEDDMRYPWAVELAQTPPQAQANAIWAGLSEAISKDVVVKEQTL